MKVKSQKSKVENLYCVMRNALCDVRTSFERKTQNAKRITYITAVIMLTLLFFFGFLSPQSEVRAEGFDACDFGPCPDAVVDDSKPLGDRVNDSIETLITSGLSLTFILIIALGIFLVIKAAYTIIRGEGDASKVEEGVQIIKSVYIGIGLIFVGLIGLLIISAFFGAEGVFFIDLELPTDRIKLPFTE